jgi:predicted phosphodiesterase
MAAHSVAVLSDVHGVLPVLEAVLAEPDVASADLLVVCGDHAAGPMPVETLDALVALGERAVLVRGNADRELVDVARGGTSEHPESQWAGEQLRQTDLSQPAGAARPTTNRVLRSLEAQRLLTLHRGRIEVLDVPGLRQRRTAV